VDSPSPGPESRIASWFCRGVIATVLIGLVVAALSHDLDLLSASPSQRRFPTMNYNPLAVPGVKPPAAGADFAQVYTSATALRNGDSAYRPTNPAFVDHFGRPSGYPPLMNWLYVPFSLLRYWPALILHSVLSLLLLLGVTVFALRTAGLQRHAPAVLLAQTCLYLLTPVGMTHLERGQFDLWVAATIVLCFACSYAPRGVLPLAVVTGLLGALKWTAAPFLGFFSALGFLLSSGRRRWAFAAIPLLMWLATIVFWKSVHEYWVTIRIYELNARPFGLTMQHFLPRTAAKLVPAAMTLALAVLAGLKARSPDARADLLVDIGAPFALALTNVGICFGTLSYEYHTVTTLGMLPVLVVWTERAIRVPAKIKALTCLSYAVFLAVVFRTFELIVAPTPKVMTGVYMAFAALFCGVCVWIVRRNDLKSRLGRS